MKCCCRHFYLVFLVIFAYFRSGIKDSTGNVSQLGDVANHVAADFNLLVGTAGALFGALALGCVGGEPRPPLMPASETEKSEIREILIKADLLDTS